jgi:FkbH-like protein
MNELFAWRAPLAPDWTERWSALDALVRQRPFLEADPARAEARWLANQRLGSHEQLKLEALARRLGPLGDALGLPRFRLGLIGNRTLGLLVGPLHAAGLARGLLIETTEAPYDSVAQFAFGAAEVFAGHKLDAVAILLDAQAFAPAGNLLDDAAARSAIEAATQYLQTLAAAVRKTQAAPAIVATIPSPAVAISALDAAMPGTTAHLVAGINGAILAGAARGDWLVWDLAELAARAGRAAWFDPVRFYEAKLPFAPAMHPLAADQLCRTIAALAGKACRALVVDLDNTLWGGVIGDDGVAGIRLGNGSAEGEAFLSFQHFLKELQRRGVVLAVCSKNDPAIAREPFRQHPEMVLKEDDFTVFRANWDDKAANLRTIAAELNLGLDAIAFADDNPAERARIRGALPAVSVPELGDDPAYYAQRIADSGVFEHLPLNQTDLGRAQSYRAAAAGAAAAREGGESYADYLRGLDMRLTVSRFDAVGAARIAQLIAKSNQFNLTTQRYSQEDVLRMAADEENILCWQARLDDRFAAHGMIAVVIVRKDGAVWAIDSWLQSCRVLGRGVEEALMNTLMAQAAASGAETVTGEYKQTARNGIVADFFPRLGFTTLDGGSMARFACRPRDYRARPNAVEVIAV